MGYPEDAGLGIECQKPSDSEKKRWCFSILDFDEEEEYVDEDGVTVDFEYARANPFIGNDKEAGEEGDRRADLWEENNECFPEKVIRHCLGRSNE